MRITQILFGAACVVTAIVIFALPFWIIKHAPKTVCTEYAEGDVTAVGGCNRYGECGVLLDGKQKVEADKPVVGEHVKVCVNYKQE